MNMSYKSTKKKPILMAAATLALLISACAPAAPAAPAAPTSAPKAETPTEAPKATEAPAAAAASGEVVTWYQYDEKNEDPKNDEAVGNAYIRDTLKKFNTEMAGKLTWVNQPQPFNKMTTSLVAAVQAGGEVPDLMTTGTDTLALYLKNETIQDVNWIKDEPWFKDLDPDAVKTCTGPDGNIYCIPGSLSTHAVFYWKEHFPNGYPKTPEEFFTQAEELKKKNVYAITYFGGTAFDGEATSRYFWGVTSSFGGKWDDGKGGMLLNTPENVKAIEFMRTVIEKGYSSEDVFLGDFKEENKFKTAESASFPTGVFAFRYIQPLKSPSGKEFGKDFDPTGQPMKDAVADGAMAFAPLFSPNGKPGCSSSVGGFVIPKGAKNLEGAKEYVRWVMAKQDNYVPWLKTVGGGFPTMKSAFTHPDFNVPYYTEAAKATAGICSSWNGSLVDVPSAKKIITGAYFELIKGKEAKNADIAGVLQKAQEEYNKLQ
jgi:multiple sugar transport system substrate-binding protein